MMKIQLIRNNIMGTLSFDAKFKGMRKVQDFIVYPMKSGDKGNSILVQSDTRIGYICLNSGKVSLCPPQSHGAYNVHLMFIKVIDTLSIQELAGIKFRLVQTFGSNSMSKITDNSGAGNVSLAQLG